MPVSCWMRRSGQPSRPNAMTCCRFSSLKTLLTSMEGNPSIVLNVLPVSIGRFSAVPHWPLLGGPQRRMGELWVGIDVSKRRLDVAIRPDGGTLICDNDTAAIKKLAGMLALKSPRLIVMEATGGHEYAAAVILSKAGLPVAIANPRQ